MARAGRMTALKVAAVARAKAPGYYGDGGGLLLQVSRFGTASWVFRYRVGGRLREMGLGSLDTIGLADARDRARKAREQRLDGLDPIEVRKGARLAAQLDSATENRQSGARSDRTHPRLGDGARLPRRREPGALARPSRQPLAGARQGA